MVYAHLKNLIVEGNTGITYDQAGPIEERRWYKIIERTLEELPFYERQGLVPTARKMGYRLVELKVMLKKQLDRYYRVTAEARRGVDYTYTKTSIYPKLPINCFRDDLRTTIGTTDISEMPQDPKPTRPPPDPEEYIDDAIQYLKDAPNDFDGNCIGGSRGVNCGKWYKQPLYCEIWCESETIQPDLLKFQNDIRVEVSAMRGQFSTPSMYKFCKRLKETAEQYDHIEKIVILYFGDSDKAGNDIRKKVEAALRFYNGGGVVDGKIILASEDLEIPVEVELRHIMITPEQVKKYKLTGYQLEAFMTTEKRLKDFKKILQEAIDECWNQDIWLQNCPPEEYDYVAYGKEKPEDIDPDNTFYDDSNDETIRDMFYRKITEAFRPGWEKE